jgi:protein-disulfide isomerase
MRRRFLPLAIVLTVGLLTLLGGAWLYRAKRPLVLEIPPAANAAENGRPDATHLRGDPGAPVTLEEFGDLQCPPCGTIAEPIAQLEKEFHGRLRVIFHHLPLSTHENARDAALAAEAAGLQGHFWELHALLYREQAVWSQAPEVRALFATYAGSLGLDVERFKKDLEGDAVEARVAADEKLADAWGIAITPTIFINDRALPPADAMRPERLRAIVEAAVKAHTGTTTTTTTMIAR